jgi:hypothetical protein
MHTTRHTLLLGLLAVGASLAIGCAAPPPSSTNNDDDPPAAPRRGSSPDFAEPDFDPDLAQAAAPDMAGPGSTDLAFAGGDLAQAAQPDMAQGGCLTNCYTIKVVDAEVPASKADLSSWDDTTAPDPYVKIQAYGGRIASTSTKTDTYFPVYNETLITLPYNDLLKSMNVLFEEYDPSVFDADDDIATWTITLTAAQVAAGTYTFYTNDGYVKLAFAPK